jgi:hypothetical protein
LLALVFLAEDPQGGRFEIVELTATDRPDEGGEKNQRQEKGGRQGDEDSRHKYKF